MRGLVTCLFLQKQSANNVTCFSFLPNSLHKPLRHLTDTKVLCEYTNLDETTTAIPEMPFRLKNGHRENPRRFGVVQVSIYW